ncbi:MAG: type VI secretion system tip protein VgrG [Deltaproteobacteria bacterium]|nr:type VI secretion system tip protein VgrG [Deltaproteobacteria bacterium]
MAITLDPLDVVLDEGAAQLPPADGSIELHGLPAVDCLLVRARHRAELGRLDDGEILVAIRESLVDFAALLGTRITLHVRRAELHRVIHGIVVRVEDMGTRMDGETGVLQTVVRLQVAPELWLLSRRKCSRVFHHATTLAVVRDVLVDAGLYQSGNLDVRVGDLDGAAIRPREHCVQYQETDLDFVMRLLEEEGLTMLFRHDASARAETLCIVDGARPLDEAYRRLDNGDARDEVDLVSDAHHQSLHRTQSFVALGAICQVRPKALTLYDYDLSNSRARVAALVTQSGDGPDVPSALDVYEHPGRYVFDPLDRPEPEPSATAHLAYPEAPRSREAGSRRRVDVRFGELRADRRVCAGRGNVMGLDPGTLFRLRNHPTAEYDREHLVTSVVHEIWAPEHPLNAGLDDARRAHGYANEITAIASDVVFRPSRTTPKPVIAGIQTGIVVGDPGCELQTDYYGRIKVQLQWDRLHFADLNADIPLGANPMPDADPRHLCWVRVAQTWAGAGWGAMFVPRVGMEVVVAFLDGDPDRPLVVGCVYNDANPPPYPLPANATRSTIRTRSTPTGKGEDRYNELRFEDSTHNEEIHLRAQRDLDEWVGRHRTTHVAENVTRRVGGDEEVGIKGNQQIGVAQFRSVNVGMDHHEHVQGHRTLVVEKTETQLVVGKSERTRGQDVLTVMGDRVTTIFGSDVVMSCGPTQTVIAPNDPAVGDEGRDEKREVEHLEQRTVRGSRKQRIDETDDYFAHTAVSMIEDSEKRTIGKSYRVNAGEEANLLVTGIEDPDDDSAGYYVDRKAVRIGSRAKSVEEVMMFRGRDLLHIGPEQITAQADDKPFEIRIGKTGCTIKLSGDGKQIEVVALEEIVLRTDKHKSSITIAKDISLDAGAGEIVLAATKVRSD